MANAKRVCVIVAAAMILVPSVTLAQEDSIYRPVSASCVPGISSNGFPGTNVTTNFSFNFLGGMNARVVGAELGSIININAKSMTGVQLSGVANVTAGWAKGVQMAGVANVVAGDFDVVQMAGVANFAGGKVQGLQLGGVFNIAVEGVVGAQISGPVNVSIGDVQVQMGVANIAIGSTHAQVGVVNFAGKAKGVQIGVVNVASEQEGIPIGLVSVAGDGFYHVNVWADETAPVNVGFKLGSRYIYNVYALGYDPLVGTPLGKMGLGLGTHIPFGPFFVDIDALQSSMGEVFRFWTWSHPDYAGLTTVRLTGGWQVLPRLAVTLGPTLNVWYSTWLNGDYARYFGLLLGDFDGADYYTDVWLGFSLGLQLL